MKDRHIDVSPETIVVELAGLGVDASTLEAIARTLADRDNDRWARMLPSCRALRADRVAEVWVHVPHGDPVTVWMDLHTGESRQHLQQLENWTPPRDVGRHH